MAAEDLAVGPGEEERVAVVTVGVPADERAPDGRPVAARQPAQQLDRRAIGRKRGVGHAVEEPHPGREELGQDDPLRACLAGLVAQRLAPAQVLGHRGDRGLQLDGCDLHRASFDARSPDRTALTCEVCDPRLPRIPVGVQVLPWRTGRRR